VDTFGGSGTCSSTMPASIRGSDLADNQRSGVGLPSSAYTLKGHFHNAAARRRSTWRGQTKLVAAVDARIINNQLGWGLQGSVGQGNYSGGKGRHRRLLTFWSPQAELGRYGAVTVNANRPKRPAPRDERRRLFHRG